MPHSRNRSNSSRTNRGNAAPVCACTCARKVSRCSWSTFELRRRLPTVVELLFAALFALYGTSLALAQEFPNKPVRLVIPYTAGGPVDIVARAMQPRIQELWGQQMIIDNKPGASAMIGSDFVAKAAPDGYTLLLGGVQTHAMNVATVKKMLYDPIRDFTPIMQTTRANWMLAVSPALNVKTAQELVALLKSQPGKYTYGSSGVGGLSHLAFEMLAAEIGVKATHVPYKGTSQAVTDLIAGQIHMVMADQGSVLQHVRGGKVTAIAMTGNTRSALLPELPTLAETIVPGFDVQAWQGLFGPPGLSAEIVRKISADFGRVLRLPDVGERLRSAGSEPVASSPEAFNAYLRREISNWVDTGKKAGIQPE